MRVLVTGGAGYIGSGVVEELLRRGHEVVGVDNFSKYGKVRKSYDDHPSYRLVEGDARDVDLMQVAGLGRLPKRVNQSARRTDELVEIWTAACEQAGAASCAMTTEL